MTQTRPSPAKNKPYNRNERGFTPDEIQARAWLTRAIEAGEYRNDRAAALEPLLRRMLYDDLLVCGHWTLELLYLASGRPHFRLYWGEYVFGVADMYADKGDIGSSRKTLAARQMLAAYLVACGWRAEDVIVVPNSAMTPLVTDTNHMYRLFKIKLPKKRPMPLYDFLADEKTTLARYLVGA